MLLVQILVVLALSVAVARYLEWSSEVNQAEFTRATTPSASDPNQLEFPVPLRAVKGQAACYRKAQRASR